MTEENEFMPTGRESTTDETRAKTLEEFARDVLADPEYQRSVGERAKAGRLTPAESRMLLEAGRRQQEDDQANKPKSKAQTFVEACTAEELDVLVAVCRRARGDAEEATVYIRKAGVRVTFAQMIDIVSEVLKP